MSAMQLAAAITLLVLTTAMLVAAQNVTFTNTTTTIITTVIMTTTNNRTNATRSPAPPRNTNAMTSTTPTTTSSRMTTLPTLSATWGPLMYCWFPCYGGGCRGYPLPQNPQIGGPFFWWFGFQFRWTRIRPRPGCTCPTGRCYRRRKGC